MPEAVTVWVVELSPGSAQERTGTLSLQPDAIVFEASVGSEDLRIPLADIRRARRLRGSPVLLVAHDPRGRAARTAFYFVQPPPLHDDQGQTERPSPLGFRKSSRRRARRQNIGYLGMWNRQLKADIQEWEHAIRDAGRAERGYLDSTEATRRPRDERYRTIPGTRANNESSPPFPTPGPG